jgi:hypothetical protein
MPEMPRSDEPNAILARRAPHLRSVRRRRFDRRHRQEMGRERTPAAYRKPGLIKRGFGVYLVHASS